ncbi:MAG: 16S rRNA (cytidine(1402)-2'-O)-methyltransferase [Proteobacteria bacterium]|nr:16S rRNA (cytidine(1402)-2'-O)-methyltransferase [Pseudomonadota bacterium]
MSAERITKAVSLPAVDVSIERPGVYVVATPIGNLGDFSARAAATLAAVDVIFCEDTRHSRRLLDHFGINTPVSALHDHNEVHMSEQLLTRLAAAGQACALISDAGTPLISDPGYAFVRSAVAAGLPVHTVPGPCAIAAALSIAGLPTARFSFEGFLPSQAAARQARLESLAGDPRTLVFYEAPHRIVASVLAMADAFGDQREAVVARELTKRFETLYRGTLADIAARMASDADASRGEFVVMVTGKAVEHGADDAELERLLRITLAETDRRAAVRIVTALSGRPRNQVYQASLRVSAADDA